MMIQNKIITRMDFLLRKSLPFIAALLLVLNTSCLDEPLTIDTFKQERMGEFLETRPEQFSEFVKLLDTTDVLGLVNAYGDYTLFAPTNEAMRVFYQEKGMKSLSDLELDSLRKIAYDHLIKGYEVLTEQFLDGLLPFLTMSDRYVSTSSKSESNILYYFVNDRSRIVGKNNRVSNGVVHVIDRVLDPSTLNIVQAVMENERFSLFVSALLETGLHLKLTKTRDESYDPKNFSYIDVTFIQGGGSKDELPVSRKYGYTILMESNETYKNRYGIETLDQLKAYAAAIIFNENAADAMVADP